MCDINTVSCPLFEGKPIKWLEDIKKSNKIKSSDSNLSVTRFKGLGEMNPSQLRETTLNSGSRKLILLSLDNKTKNMSDVTLSFTFFSSGYYEKSNT